MTVYMVKISFDYGIEVNAKSERDAINKVKDMISKYPVEPSQEILSEGMLLYTLDYEAYEEE